MSLAAGSRLGPYEVLSPLGAGGMGEVYKARDTRLHREVAIKVLPAQLSSDADRLRRFEQEARAAGVLNNPSRLEGIEASGRRFLQRDLRLRAPSLCTGAGARRAGFRSRSSVNSGIPDEISPITLLTNWTAELARK